MFPRLVPWLLLVWLVVARVAVPLMAAEFDPNPRSAPRYRVTRWTADNGLPQNRIACLTQTRDGYLWIGTWFGLARFDGVRFTVFDKYNTPELVSDTINALAEDTDGTLWIGTADSLVNYRDHRFRRVTVAEGLPDWKVWRLAASRSGGIWLHSGVFVTRLQDGKFSPPVKLVFAPYQTIHSLKEGADGWLEIITSDGRLSLSPAVDQLKAIKSPPLANWLAGCAGKHPGSLWLGTALGLYHWEHETGQMVGAEELGPRIVSFIFEDRAGQVWVNTKKDALRRWDGEHWVVIDVGDRLNPPAVVCMAEDREGNFWVGTDQGLYQLQSRRVRAFTSRDGLPDDEVWSVCEGGDETIWLATRHGLGRIPHGKAALRTLAEPEASHGYRCVWPSRNGGVWAGKLSSGLLEFCDGQLTQRVAAQALPNANLLALYEDRQGRLWIGTGNGVAVFADGKLSACYTNWAGRSDYDVKCIVEDRTGAMWFGTQGQGLVRFRAGKFEVFSTRNGLSNDHVWCIHEDAEGTLWLGTANGLTRYREGRFFGFTRQHGLMENTVNWVLEDEFSSMWLSGLRGIYRVKRAQLNAVADGRARVVECASFGAADGMESSETNGENQPAGWRARDGRLWFPTTCGVVVIDPKTIPINEVPPPAVIEQVIADQEVVFGDKASMEPESRGPQATRQGLGRKPQREHPRVELAKPGKLRLGAGRARVLEIHYTANSFADPGKIRFRTRLVGVDTEWREAGVNRTAVFTTLRPGDYRFEVKACNNHGVWNETPTPFAFSLAPHLWQTWPFYGASGMLLALAGLAWHYQRVGVLRRIQRLEQQRTLQEERVRIAKDLHDDLGANLSGLALQLEVLRAQSRSPDSLQNRLALIARNTRALVDNMREVIWAVNPRYDDLENLASFLGQYTENYLATAGLRCRLELPAARAVQPLDSQARHELFLVVKEALHNIVRHARASEVKLRVEHEEDELRLTIIDNGCGVSPEATRRPGHGLENMEKRVKGLNGSFCLAGQPTQGTRITVVIPLRHWPPSIKPVP